MKYPAELCSYTEENFWRRTKVQLAHKEFLIIVLECMFLKYFGILSNLLVNISRT